ncbi:CubicO group peptidase (beta-lactamase class C family) [Chitinophaga skermanii]|uniref:CubicO group peptidase (Beta-lactamase class C family) n=1 Tax=Chitinophaga skermanii TaxID=331697 RepID=A0A327Q0B8_9BACT|nr:serine hydrolase domain-containing protein [Chitinophaga skermanii]RAI97890.1 CubicO group peptidase (beta-lactamase class C family) [Chitinophaga skermanii]
MYCVSTRFIHLLGIVYFIIGCQIATAYGQKPVPKEVQTHIDAVETNLAVFFPKTDSITGYASLAERMAYYNVNALSIAVINNGKLEWAKAYGFANAEDRIEATPTTMFQAASISKSVNALCVMKLVDEKKLSLTEDVRKYLSGWRLPISDTARGYEVNLANLLSHTAGLSVHGFEGYEVGKPMPTSTVAILNGKPPTNSPAVQFVTKPNVGFKYSGGGILVVQEILEEQFNLPYTTILDKKVLIPLQMKHSTFTQPLPVECRDKAAVGYRVTGKPLTGKWHIYPEQAAAGLWTTPSDLANFIIAIQKSYNKKKGFIKQQTAHTMVTPYLAGTKVGLGVFESAWGDTPFFNHGGANEGFRSFYCGSLTTGKGIVIMINSDNDRIFKEIVYTVAKDYNWKNEKTIQPNK